MEYTIAKEFDLFTEKVYYAQFKMDIPDEAIHSSRIYLLKRPKSLDVNDLLEKELVSAQEPDRIEAELRMYYNPAKRENRFLLVYKDELIDQEDLVVYYPIKPINEKSVIAIQPDNQLLSQIDDSDVLVNSIKAGNDVKFMICEFIDKGLYNYFNFIISNINDDVIDIIKSKCITCPYDLLASIFVYRRGTLIPIVNSFEVE